MRKITAALFVYCLSLGAIDAQVVRQVTSGVTAITFDPSALNSAGLAIPLLRPSDASPPGISQFLARPKSNLNVAFGANGDVTGVAGRLIHAGSFTVTAGARVLRVRDFQIVRASDASSLLLMAGTLPLFRMSTTQMAFTPDTETLVLGSTPLRVTSEAATALGISAATDQTIGQIAFTGSTMASTAATLASLPAAPVLPAPPLIVPSDLTFCELHSLSQFGRDGNAVGLAAATTSWNIGSQKLDWWAEPDWRHPYIVQNLYRIKDDRFEQIGQSWVKHGFFALSDSQCDTQCSESTDGTSLAPGCTDTYGASTNAAQGSLRPRFEIDPWDGIWTDTGALPPVHNSVDHRLQVDDADLDPTRNDNATYFLEGYYVHYQDIEVMNSASWKPTTVSGSPGGIWRFVMSLPGVRPNIGFALDAWTGARKSVLAETSPPVKFSSNDGRSLLAAKATQLGSGRWRYVYALLNVDMDRQVASFEIALTANTNITDVAFHAPLHNGEAINAPGGIAITNDPWTAATGPTAVTWTTSTNPLRWGSVYTYSFVADRPPSNVTVTVKPFRGKGAATISATTLGPQ
jgi:hypothetical protein